MLITNKFIFYIFVLQQKKQTKKTSYKTRRMPKSHTSRPLHKPKKLKMKTASYNKTPQGDGFLFNVTPAPKTSGGCAGMFLYIALGLLSAFLIG